MQYTRHARQRMAQRRITQADVELVVNDPDVTHEDRDGNPAFIRTVDKRRIRVVISASTHKVITTIVLDD